MRIFKFICYAMILMVIFIACQKDEVVLPFIAVEGDQYIPHEPGFYQVYRVDSVIYTFSNNSVNADSSVSFQKIENDTFMIEEMDTVIRRFSYHSKDPEGPYQYQSTITYIKNKQGTFLLNNNFYFEVINYPVSLLPEWDGNRFFDDLTGIPLSDGNVMEIFKNWEYKVVVVEEDSEVLIVEEVNSSNLIERRYSVRHYAPDLGLIYEHRQFFDTQCILYNEDFEKCMEAPWEEKTEKGFQITRTLIEHS